MAITKRFNYLDALLHSSHDLKTFPLPIAIPFIMFRAKCLLPAVTSWEENGGAHPFFIWLSSETPNREKNKSELSHKECHFPCWNKVMAMSGADVVEACLKLALQSFPVVLPHVFTISFRSQVLSLISNPTHLLSCANTLLCNFNSALRNMLWFLITKPIIITDLFARWDIGKSIQSTLGYFTLFFAFCGSCKAWVAHILWIRNELPAISSGLCNKCFQSVETLAADQVPFVLLHFLLSRITTEAKSVRKSHPKYWEILLSRKRFCRTCLEALLSIWLCLMVYLCFFQLSDKQQEEFDCNIQHISNSPTATFPSSWTRR